MSSQARAQLKRRTFHQDVWPRKTIDIGANGVTVSANPLGQIYQISCPLRAENNFGIMVAAPWPQFDHAQRTNPVYVRNFRKIPEKLLMQQRSGLGLDIGGQKGPVVIRHVQGSIGSQVQFEYRLLKSNIFVQTALRVHEDGLIIHASKVTNSNDKVEMIPVTLDMIVYKVIMMKLLRKLDSTKLAWLLPNNSASASQYDEKIRQALTKHLTWLFKMAVTEIEIDGQIRYFWRRSYLVNGKPKDGEVFQLDTQCYPFLELCEYFDAHVGEPETELIIQNILQTASFINILWDLLSRRDSATSLFSSDETPADDDLGNYKFHLSSNILAWHTLDKLGELLSRPQFSPLAPAGVDGGGLRNLAAMIKDSILVNFRSRQFFTFSGGQRIDQDILAYGLDPSKELDDSMRYRHYHDGNDLPTLYAQEWGLLKSNAYDEYDEPDLRALWEKTMVWAFTPGSASAGFNPGYQGDGTEPFHGLGSDHSPGPWTLGFFQEWRFAQMVGDEGRAHKAWRQIDGSAQFDGTFSEAVDIHTGVCTSKTWFSWPGAMIAENLIDTVIGQVQQLQAQHAEQAYPDEIVSPVVGLPEVYPDTYV
ncbi:hypothetical protein UCDDA912_g07709 [Diaporthe ampelina]|uniref:Uncharacterized protein n=1 Tax=Diaporthe ampelina TaxID=1214573 RepID=A0A0G2HAX0_9PEZI|nr:hypothetical protein UCDDA912_g07709 [Diaporthe ampelina]